MLCIDCCHLYFRLGRENKTVTKVEEVWSLICQNALKEEMMDED